jgi:hypothetical protein
LPSFIKLIKLSRKLKGSIENGKRHRQQWETMGIRHRQKWETMGIRHRQQWETMGIRHSQQWETMGIRHRQQWDTMGIRKTRTNITRKLKSRATRTLPYKTGMNPGAHEG